MQPNLVKYGCPQLERTVNADSARGTLSSPPRSSDLLSAKGITTEDLLDSILPPREWNQNGEVWTQRVSSTPATRGDVIAVEEELDKRLKQIGARDYGICNLREHLYSQCFDEILRQVTVACAERGLLLHKVRAELSTMINAYGKLYESSAAFGMRKALQMDHDNFTESLGLKQLGQRKDQLKQELEMLHGYLANIEKSATESKDQEEQQHMVILASLKKKSQRVKHELERHLSIAAQK